MVRVTVGRCGNRWWSGGATLLARRSTRGWLESNVQNCNSTTITGFIPTKVVWWCRGFWGGTTAPGRFARTSLFWRIPRHSAPFGKIKPGNCPGTCPFWGGLEVAGRWRDSLISGIEISWPLGGYFYRVHRYTRRRRTGTILWERLIYLRSARCLSWWLIFLWTSKWVHCIVAWLDLMAEPMSRADPTQLPAGEDRSDKDQLES